MTRQSGALSGARLTGEGRSSHRCCQERSFLLQKKLFCAEGLERLWCQWSSLQHQRGWVGLSRVRAVEPLQGWGRLGPVLGQGTAPCQALSAAFLLLLSNFLVTVGSDRKIKFWDLRRLYEPINSIKRFLSTEVAWLLPYNGITVAQDNCYAP